RIVGHPQRSNRKTRPELECVGNPAPLTAVPLRSPSGAQCFAVARGDAHFERAGGEYSGALFASLARLPGAFSSGVRPLKSAAGAPCRLAAEQISIALRV